MFRLLYSGAVDTNGFIDAVGGRQRIIALTGLTKGRISQWVTDNDIPRPWLKFLIERYPSEAREYGLVKREGAT